MSNIQSLMQEYKDTASVMAEAMANRLGVKNTYNPIVYALNKGSHTIITVSPEHKHYLSNGYTLVDWLE